MPISKWSLSPESQNTGTVGYILLRSLWGSKRNASMKDGPESTASSQQQQGNTDALMHHLHSFRCVWAVTAEWKISRWWKQLEIEVWLQGGKKAKPMLPLQLRSVIARDNFYPQISKFRSETSLFWFQQLTYPENVLLAALEEKLTSMVILKRAQVCFRAQVWNRSHCSPQCSSKQARSKCFMMIMKRVCCQPCISSHESLCWCVWKVCNIYQAWRNFSNPQWVNMPLLFSRKVNLLWKDWMI